MNTRALIGLGLLVTVAAVIAAASWATQVARGRPTLLAEARKLAAQKPPKDDLALSYLKEYMASRPRDPEALALKADILARSARTPEQLIDTVRLGETMLAQESKPPSTQDLENRRRLARAYLAIGPMLPATERKYAAAVRISGELSAITKTADDIRLHAQCLAFQAGTVDRETLAMSAARYEEARKLDPGDVEGVERLAGLYLILKDRTKFQTVLASLLKTTPTVPAYLAAARSYALAADDAAGSGRSAEVPGFRAQADSMIAQAVKLDPKSLEVRLQAAKIDLDAKKPAQAAAHLDAVAEKDRQDYRYLTYRGVVALYDNKATDAVESWTRGLAVTGGTEAELSWRLAYVLLNLGRIDEADELIKQYKRLAGNFENIPGETPPTALFLEALKFLKLNQPMKAIAALERGRLKMPSALKPQFYLTLGTASEAVRDNARALDEYRKATEADPKFIPPRLARARLLQISGREEEAAEELRRGLSEVPGDPGMITALARLELNRQGRRPQGRKSWEELQKLLDQGRIVAPSSAALAVVRANAMAAQGQIEAAADLLEKATAIDPADVELWVARAEKLVVMGRLDRALDVINQAMEPKAAGDQAALRILRARIQTIRGQGVEAREGLIRDLEKVRPDQRPELWKVLGELHSAQGDPAGAQAARRAFDQWAKLLPDDPIPRLFVLELSLSDPSDDAAESVEKSRDALRTLGGIYAQIGEATFLLRDRGKDKETAEDRATRLSSAERYIDKIEKDAPQSRYGPMLRGALLQQKGDLAGAAKAYERGLRADGGKVILPRLVSVYNQMGPAGRSDLERLAAANPDAAQGITRSEAEAEAKAGNKERAEALARKVVAGDPESLEVRVWEARLLNTLGEPKKAETTLRGLIEKHPESLGPWMALLYFQVSIKDMKAAHQTAEQLVASVKDLERPELAWGQAWRIAGDRKLADEAFDAALKRWPDDPRVSRGAAEYYTATLRTARAEEILRQVLKRDETQQWASRGVALILSGRPADPAAWQEAWALVRDTAPGGDLPEDRLIRAVVLSRGPEVSNRDAAIATLSKLVADLPADLPAAKAARDSLVQSLVKTDPARAAEFAAVDARSPSATPAALSLHVAALIASKQYDDAERQLARLDAAAPGDASALALRIRLLRGRGKQGEAAETLEKVAAEKLAKPDSENEVRSIIQVLVSELDDNAAALRVADKLVAKYPKAEGVKAAVLARMGKRDEALAIYMKVIESGDPASMREAARNSLAMVTRDKFDAASIAQAEKVITAARAKDPKSPDLLAMAGYLCHFQGRYDDELKIYQEALANNPDDFTLMNNMAWTLSEGLNKPDEALETVTKAIKKAVVVPPQLYDTRGCIYTRMGKLDLAIQDLQVAAHERPSGTILAHLARAYHKAGKTAEFEKAKENAKKTGLTPEMLEKSDRTEIEPLIFGK